LLSSVNFKGKVGEGRMSSHDRKSNGASIKRTRSEVTQNQRFRGGNLGGVIGQRGHYRLMKTGKMIADIYCQKEDIGYGGPNES